MLDDLLLAPECESTRQAASEVLGKNVEQWWNSLDNESIYLNSNAQFAIAFYQLATWDRISSLLPEVNLIAGYSLGELIGYYVAGALSAAETFKLVRERARLMDESAGVGIKNESCMALWRGRVSPATLAARDLALQKFNLDIAIKRKDGEIVLAGLSDSISRFVEELQVMNPNLLPLPVTIPAHSHYLASAAEKFHAILNSSAILSPQIPILSSVEAMPVRSRDEAVIALSRQISTTIRWDECMEAIAESGIDKVIELGPGNDLAKLIGAEHSKISARAVSDFSNFRSLADWLNC
jgi:[acyl-carrier-protein] S-malonyltransferase